MGDVTLGFYIHNSVRRMTMKLLAIKGLLLSFHSSSRSCGSSHINNVILSCIAIPKAISNYLNTTILYKTLVSSTSLCSTSPVKLTFALQIIRQSTWTSSKSRCSNRSWQFFSASLLVLHRLLHLQQLQQQLASPLNVPI